MSPAAVIHDPREMRTWANAQRAQGHRIALVPTMGSLHAGHLSLVQRAADLGDRVVVSIFVNPTQFAPNEDLADYPRDLARDLESLNDLGLAHAVFAPTPDAVYSTGFDTYVVPDTLAQNLCGLARPAHFRGVATVVLVLFRITRCQVAVFGEKDFQQLTILRQMARDFWLDVEVVGMPTVREADGMAKSSRNTYLSDAERREALVLSRTLQKLVERVAKGERHTPTLLAWARRLIEATGAVRIDYLEIVAADTLQSLRRVDRESVCAAAIFVGTKRLIDNIRLLP